MQFSAAPDISELTGTVWQLQEIQYNDGNLLTAEPPENYTLEFFEDGSIVAKADCNQAIGSFSTTASREIMVGPLATTSAACAPESIGDEYVQGLSNSAIYFFQDGNLFLDIRYDTGTMRFAPAGS
jgi:heat shock protein HslJ